MLPTYESYKILESLEIPISTIIPATKILVMTFLFEQKIV